MLQNQKNKSTLRTLLINNTLDTIKQWLQQKREKIATWDKYSEEHQEIEIILIDELLEELEQ